MNRDIEFRIWADNQFYYKCLVGNTNNIEDNNWTCPMVWLEDKKEWVNCDNGVIQQYTGLKDKNGKKIFEGDIVLINGKYTDEVIFECGCFLMKKQLYNYEFTYQNFDNLEVIGNIYENKELLEV